MFLKCASYSNFIVSSLNKVQASLIFKNCSLASSVLFLSGWHLIANFLQLSLMMSIVAKSGHYKISQGLPNFLIFSFKIQFILTYVINISIQKMEGMLSGAIASSITTTILYPWEKIKIQMQTDQDHKKLIKTIRNIYQKQGMQGFYKGLRPLIFGNSLSYAIYFFLYQKAKLLFPDKTIVTSLKCSLIAGVGCTLIVNPFWVLQTKAAVSKDDEGIVVTLFKEINSEGIGFLWKGIGSSLILVSNPIVQFTLFEWFKLRLDPKSKYFDALIFFNAAFSKAIATLVTYPYTVIRTYQHLDKSKKKITEVTSQIWNENGLKGFFKGLTPKMIQTVLNSAMLLTIYERLTKAILEILKSSMFKKIIRSPKTLILMIIKTLMGLLRGSASK